MTGGSLNLASTKGSGVDIINTNPQITFFKKVYKRHTNFGIENIEQSINITPNFGSNNIEIKIQKSGSLVADMHMEFTLPPVAGTGGVDKNGKTLIGSNDGIVTNYKLYARWVNAVGFAIINNIKLKLDNDIIDEHSGLWFDIWNELTDPNKKEWPLVGKYNDNRGTESTRIPTRYYIPLKFYFNRNPGLALPIFLLNENSLKIDLSLNSLKSLLQFGYKDNTTAINTNASLSNFKFFVNYVFLEPEEESRIRSNLPSEYLVETVDEFTNISSSQLSKLNFENPVKEIIWVFRNNNRLRVGDATEALQPLENIAGEDSSNPNDIFNYTSLLRNSTDSSFDVFKSLILNIDNRERFRNTEASFFRTMQPYKYHSNIPGGSDRNIKKQYIYVYSFALNPEEYQPSGAYNFSKDNDTANFNFTFHTDIGNTKAVPAISASANALGSGARDYQITLFTLQDLEVLVIQIGY